MAREHPYLFPGVEGWDGQWYHAIAHDPRLRYRRILIPALAYLLAAGHDAFIDTAYRAVILLFFAFGAWWLARLAQAAGRPVVLGIVFFFLPASVAAIDRQAIDVGLLCFCCGFALYTRYVKNPRELYAVLLFAGLVRETGLLLAAAYCIWLPLRREVRSCVVFATTAGPAIAWYVFVNSRTLPDPGAGAVAVPFAGVLDRLVHLIDYPEGLIAGLLHGLDFLAAAGVLLAMPLLGIFVWRPGDWLEALDYGRILSPLLFFEALAGLEGPLFPALAPLCMVLPRFGLQMASQALGVLRGLLAGA